MAHCTLKRFNDAPLYLLLNLPFSNKKISCTNACRLAFMIIPYMWDLVMTGWLWLVALCLKTQFWGWSYNTLIQPIPNDHSSVKHIQPYTKGITGLEKLTWRWGNLTGIVPLECWRQSAPHEQRSLISTPLKSCGVVWVTECDSVSLLHRPSSNYRQEWLKGEPPSHMMA